MRVLGTLVAAFIAAAPAAIAADLDLPPMPDFDMPLAAEFGDGWYLRGDLGYSWVEAPVGAYVLPAATTAFANETLDDRFNAGFGFGYSFSPWFRLDLTGDWWTNADFNASRAGAVERGELQSLAVLANAYVDLGAWYGVTPYVGAGIGASWNRISHASIAGAARTDWPETDQWNLAWALMAGFGIDLAEDLVLDAGYRFIHLGDAETAADAAGGRVTYDGIAHHEVRLGLRYLIR